ncbi:MAG: hypothetical protein RR922_01195 [Clostridia bacterium]
MKILDYAVIFIIIILPVILVVNINTSIKIKSQNMEVYYKNLIDSAISDASQEMKEVENTDNEVDYGYSGDGEKKVSINAQHAVNTFLDSMYFNFNIKGSQGGEDMLKTYIPAIAVIDYNGIHIYSVERFKNEAGQTVTKHILKPKKYFSYSYKLKVNGPGNAHVYEIVPSTTPSGGAISDKIYTVNFTLNNYITYIATEDEPNLELKKGENLKRFMQDTLMTKALFGGVSDEAYYEDLYKQLDAIRRQTIVNIVADEVSYAINKHNTFASSFNTTYRFNFPAISEDDWYATVQDTGILAFVQGMAVGNKFINHYSYGLSKLSYSQKYWPTEKCSNLDFFGITGPGALMRYDKLYHKDKTCSVYKQTTKVTSPVSFSTRYEAASGGYSPCPVCMYDTIDYYYPDGLDRTKPITLDIIKNGLKGEEEAEKEK